MKKLLTFIVVLAALYSGAAWLTGWAIQNRLETQMTRQQNPYARIVAQRYQRGWFRSEQDVTLALFTGLNLPAPRIPASAKGLQITVHNVIHHGPICGWNCFALARIDTVLALNGDADTVLRKLYGSAQPLSIITRLGFSGGTRTSLSSPPIQNAALDGGSHISWGGLNIVANCSKNCDRIRLHGAAPHLLVVDPTGKRLEISGITLDTSSERVLGTLHATNSELDVEQMSYASSQSAQPFTLRKLRYVVQSPIADGYMNVTAQLGTGAIQAGIAALREAHFDMTVRHLQLQALAAFDDKVRKYNQQNVTGLKPDPGGLLSAVRESAEQLLMQHPEFSLDRFVLNTVHGQIGLHGSVTAPGLSAADLAGNWDAKALLPKILADFDLSIDDSALADLPALQFIAQAQFQRFAQQGDITHENGRWHTAIQFAQGHTTLNGRAFLPASPPSASGTAPANP